MKPKEMKLTTTKPKKDTKPACCAHSVKRIIPPKVLAVKSGMVQKTCVRTSASPFNCASSRREPQPRLVIVTASLWLAGSLDVSEQGTDDRVFVVRSFQRQEKPKHLNTLI